MQQSLAGRTIVVTRPEAQAEALSREIERRGGKALRFPVLGIAPPHDDAELLAVAARLDDFALAFFVSPNAVEHALSCILAHRGWPPQLPVATVGPGSAQVLHAAGFEHVIVPREGFDSEAVLELPEFSAARLAGRKVVIFRGDGGRELLAETLTQRGAEVVKVTAYHRYCPRTDPTPLVNMALAGHVDALVLTSSEGVRNLVSMLKAPAMAVLAQVPVFAPHPRIAGHALEAGFHAVIETDGGDAGILMGLERGLGSASDV